MRSSHRHKAGGPVSIFQFPVFLRAEQRGIHEEKTHMQIRHVGHPRPRLEFEMEDVYDHIGAAVQKYDVSADEHVRAIRRRRWQAALEIFRAVVHTLLQTWRQGAAHDQLAL